MSAQGLLVTFRSPDGFVGEYEFTLDADKLGLLAGRARRSKRHVSQAANGGLKCRLVRTVAPARPATPPSTPNPAQ